MHEKPARFPWPTLSFLILVSTLMSCPVSAAEEPDSTWSPAETEHGDEGFVFRSPDDRFLLRFDSRLQFRYAYPSDTDPVTEDEFIEDSKHDLKINRARLKIGGHAFRSWFEYYWEYDLAGSNLLDYRVMITKHDWLKFKAGQWKAQYSRERIISSGRQQLADRSIINRVFTIDRQQGVSLYGRLKGSGAIDFNYWASVFMGTGRGAGGNDDDHLMWMGRLQWNPLGRVVPFAGSDTEHHTRPAALVAVAGVTNRSPYTRFSTSGGGTFDGTPGEPGQYRVSQYLIETAFMYRGFSWQHESHWKDVEDTVNLTEGRAVGSYFQAGFFPHGLLGFVPRPLELAARYAYYTPDTAVDDDTRHEVTVVLNCFFWEHRNKITAEISAFDLEDAGTRETQEETRFRLQWDVSL